MPFHAGAVVDIIAVVQLSANLQAKPPLCPMNIDFAKNQGLLLARVADIQIRQGVCFALSTEWCLCVLRSRNFSFEGVLYQAVARQRAYNLTWAEQIRNLTDGDKYVQFFQIAEPPTYRFMQDQARHEGVTCQRLLAQPNLFANQLASAVNPGGACILGLFGVEYDKNHRLKNWGHAVAIGWRNIAGGKPRFFDPNQGQFSWPDTTGNDVIAREIIANLHEFYDLGTVRNAVIYSLT
jgi:hypothetical protein